MTKRQVTNAAFAVAALFALAACNGAQQQSAQATATAVAGDLNAASIASNSMGSAAAAAMKAMLAGPVAPVPTSLHCGDVPPVWVYAKRKSYNTAISKFYGHGKHGKYMCLAQAIALGYHKGHRHFPGSVGGSAAPAASSTP